MDFKTQTVMTKDLYTNLLNKKQQRRKDTISLIILAVVPVFVMMSLLDAESTRSIGFNLFGLITGFLSILILQLPRLTISRGIKKAQESGVLDTQQVVEFSEEGILKNDAKMIPYRDVLAILITPDKYLLTSKGSEWTFVDRETLESGGHKKAFEKFLEENCRQARWTQTG